MFIRHQRPIAVAIRRHQGVEAPARRPLAGQHHVLRTHRLRIHRNELLRTPERFHHRSTGGLWREGLDLLQVYEVTVPGVRPALRPELDDTSQHRWVTWAELEALCSEHFWWALVAAMTSRFNGWREGEVAIMDDVGW